MWRGGPMWCWNMCCFCLAYEALLSSRVRSNRARCSTANHQITLASIYGDHVSRSAIDCHRIGIKVECLGKNHSERPRIWKFENSSFCRLFSIHVRKRSGKPRIYAQISQRVFNFFLRWYLPDHTVAPWCFTSRPAGWYCCRLHHWIFHNYYVLEIAKHRSGHPTRIKFPARHHSVWTAKTSFIVIHASTLCATR